MELPPTGQTWTEQYEMVSNMLRKLKVDIDQLEQRVHSLSASVSNRRHDVNLPAMTTAARAKVHNLTQVAKDLNEEIRSLLKHCKGDSGRSNQLKQLENRAISEVSRLQRLSRSVADIIRQQSTLDHAQVLLPVDDLSQDSYHLSSLPEPRLQLQFDADPASVQLQQEEEQAMRLLEDDILKVNEIFSTLAGFVHEQGSLVDSLEAHVDEAHTQVDTGRRQLSSAVRHRNSARRKKCICAIVIVVILIIVAIILAVEFSPSK